MKQRGGIVSNKQPLDQTGSERAVYCQQSSSKFDLNIRLNEKEIDSRKTIIYSKPRLLMIVLTTKCNLRCTMCILVRNTLGKELTIPLETIKKTFYLFPYLEGISWQGGEVFLVDYFKDLFIKISQYPNIRQTIITNGLLIDEEWAKILAESTVNLTYSIDAVTKRTYEKIRRGAKFDDLLKSVNSLSRAARKYNGNIYSAVHVVVMKSNYRELHLFPEFCQRFGFRFLNFAFCVGDFPEQDILIQKDKAAIDFLRESIPKIESACSRLDVGFDYSFKNCLERQEANAEKEKNPGEAKLKCKLPWKKLFIDISRNGLVRPSCLCKFNLGSIFDNEIEQLWNNQIMQQYRFRLGQGNVKDFCSDVCLNNSISRFELEGRP
jgi:MoaA/NifB/PqqE/SkfB family radical SAM enzyme